MRNRPYGLKIYLVNVKTIKTIVHIFVAFSEKLYQTIGTSGLQKLTTAPVIILCRDVTMGKI